MLVRFKIDGGFVYLPTRSEPVTIDTDDLPAEDVNELERLIEAADFFELPQTSPPPRGAADYLRYTISVTCPERSHTVHLTDPIEDPDVQALVEYMEAKAERNQADADNGRVAAITLSHDTMKHITTLVTASIVAIVTLLKTVFSNPDLLWLGFVSIVSLIAATVCAVFTMSGLVFYRGLIAEPDTSDVTKMLLILFNYWLVFFAQLLCLGFFVMGLFLFAGFSIINLWP